MNTKIVTHGEHRYQLRKLRPDVGSYVYYRMMGALMEFKQKAPEGEVPETNSKMTNEEKARLLCGMAVMKLSFEDLQFANRHAMQVVSKEVAGHADTFIPVMKDNGQWVDDGIVENESLHQALVMDSLVYSLAGFFSGSGETTAAVPATTNP